MCPAAFKHRHDLSAVSSFSLPSALSPLVGSNIYVKPGAEIRVYHLVRPEGPAGGGGGAGGQETAARAVPEVFLTRLLATKGNLTYLPSAYKVYTLFWRQFYFNILRSLQYYCPSLLGRLHPMGSVIRLNELGTL